VTLPAHRVRQIGGSDIAAILGISPWTTAFGVWHRVTTGEQPDNSTDATRAGQRFERLLRDEYERRTGYDVVDEWDGSFDTPEWVASSLDGAVWKDGAVWGVVEVKCPGLQQRHEWGEDGSVWPSIEAAVEAGAVPPHYAVQVGWYMLHTGARWADFVVGFRGGIDGVSAPIVIRVLADDDQHDALWRRVLGWYEKHVAGGEQPPIDGSPEAAAYLSRRNPGDENLRRPATEGEVALMRRSLALKAQIEALEAERAAVTNALRESVGDAVAVYGDGVSLSLPVAKPTRRIAGLSEIEKKAPDLVSVLAAAGLVKEATGSRTLTVREHKE
jgi:putative phage-type endonuclease